MECTTIAYKKRHYFPVHLHPDLYTFSLVLHGHAKLISDGQCLHLKAGDMVVIPPNVAHQTLVEHSFIYKLIRVPAPYSFKNNLKNDISVIPLERNVKLVNEFEQWYDAVVESTKNKNSIADKKIKIPVFFQSFIQSEAGLDNDTYKVMKKTVDFFNENINRPFTTEELSDTVCMSQSHFQRVFKTIIGIAPKRYLMNLRIETAKELIKVTDNFTDIAYNTGFYDQSHFIRYFKINVGMIPKQYSDLIHNDRIVQF